MFDIFKRKVPDEIKNGSKAVVQVQRYNPETDDRPTMQSFDVPMTPETTILDALHFIKTELDGTLTFRRSCRHAICGSCAMNINGANDLVCHRPLSESLNHKGVVVIRPLPFLPVIKDLVVDRSSFWAQYKRVKPWLVPPDSKPNQEFRVSPQEVEALQNAETCIMCGACYSSCQVIAMNKEYVGPHALLKAFLRVIDPRDMIPDQRLADLDGHDGVYRCHTIFNCIDACPKGLNPTQAIETLRKLAQRRIDVEEQRQNRQRSIRAANGQ